MPEICGLWHYLETNDSIDLELESGESSEMIWFGAMLAKFQPSYHWDLCFHCLENQ